MIFAGHAFGDGYVISLKDTSLTVGINGQSVFAYDRGGRLYSLFDNGYTYRRGLDGRILLKWQGEDSRQRRWLAEPEADALMDIASAAAHRLIDLMDRPGWQWTQPPEPDARQTLIDVLERAARFDSQAANADAKSFCRVYRPIGILPPDQYLALVLQATVGCSFTTCAFCNLYPESFRVKSPAEFDQHIADVRRYLGDSLSLRQKTIFLGSANALALPMPRLLPLFERLTRNFDTSAHGIYAFVDGFTSVRKGADDYRALAELGLRRVYVGLESGHDPLLEFVCKPGTSGDAIETVRAIKAAGVCVGVIVMIGLGGDRFVERHTLDTIRALQAMELGAGDLIYFSDLVEDEGTPYPGLAASHGIRRLTASERAAQRSAIRDALRFGGPPPKISNYDIREFVY